MHADSALTAKVKDYALRTLRADLVGVANIGRFEKAPLRMSPQGIMPSAKSVIVMAVHHPDAAVELGGMEHPQKIGPYAIQYVMNWRLDDMSYRMALFVEKLGFKAVPIASSNIWRYKGYKNLNEHFAADISHMHAAVAAGLCEFGYNGLAISPEFGARNRFVSIICDAELSPSPLLEPGSVCDNCMLCAKHCMSGALTKELDGWNFVEIEDKKYKYVKKNLWRCAWGEHFDLDLDLKIPEKVTEETIIEHVKQYGLRGGEMGSCLRYCLPKALRYWDRTYTNAPRRKKHTSQIQGVFHRGLLEELHSIGAVWGADTVIVSDSEALNGVNMTDYLPGAKRAVSILYSQKAGNISSFPEEANPYSRPGSGVRYILEQSAYDACRLLERFGYEAVTLTEFQEESLLASLGTGNPAGKQISSLTLFTNAELPLTERSLPAPAAISEPSPEKLRKLLEESISKFEGDAMGVSSCKRMDELCDQLEKYYGDDEFLDAKDKALRFYSFEPEISVKKRRVLRPSDYLPGAKSIVVIGLRVPEQIAEATARNEAEAVGPCAFAQYESVVRLRLIATNLQKLLEDNGFNACFAFDMSNTSSVTGNPRGEQPDAFSNNFAAFAAGLGRLGKCGALITPKNGTNMRFVALICDAPLPEDALLDDPALNESCSTCNACVSACPTGAFGDEIKIELGGLRESLRKIDRKKCDWAKRYSLSAEEGNKYLGWKLDESVPETIDDKSLDAALRKQPPIPKYRPCNFESCLMACPHTRTQSQP